MAIFQRFFGEPTALNEALGNEVMQICFYHTFWGGHESLDTSFAFDLTFWQVPSVAAHQN
jgi:hypothetical protein